MKIINLNTGEGYKAVTFPDGEPHVTLEDIGSEYMARVICSLTTSKKLAELCMVAEVLNRKEIYWELHIPYLMGARYDRVMEDKDGELLENDSVGLYVVAGIINSLGPAQVYLFDPHSEVAQALILGSKVINNKALVRAYDKEDAVLIIPDAGAAKKSQRYFKWNPHLTSSVQCVKHRDPHTGTLTLQVNHPEVCRDRNCVIIDDICDGGRTFTSIADQISPANLTLIVTHGIFSAGMQELDKRFDQIITSDSYPPIHKGMESKVKIISYNHIQP